MKSSMQQSDKNENTETNSTKHLVYTTKFKKTKKGDVKEKHSGSLKYTQPKIIVSLHL